MHKDKKENPNQKTCSYLTFNTVDWVDVFNRPVYKEVIADALNQFIKEKGLIVYSWCLMTNHLHLVADCKPNTTLALFERDFKKYTTNEILEAIDLEPDLRRTWMLQRFEHFSQSLKRIEKIPDLAELQQSFFHRIQTGIQAAGTNTVCTRKPCAR